MPLLDEDLIKPKVDLISGWKLLAWPVLIGFGVGAITNYVNAIIGYLYFVWIGHRAIGDFPPYQELGISLLGGVEGGGGGLIFSWVFLAFYSERFKRRGKWTELKRRFLKVGGIVMVFWLLAGLMGAYLCDADPTGMANFFAYLDPRFKDLPTKLAFELVGFGFVAFALWGCIIGGVIGSGWVFWDTLRARRLT